MFNNFTLPNFNSGDVNQYGIAQGLQNSFEQSQQPDWQKYLEMLNAQQGMMQQQQQAPMMPAPQAPPIQAGQAQTGVGYRQPTYMKKGLLG